MLFEGNFLEMVPPRPLFFFFSKNVKKKPEKTFFPFFFSSLEKKQTKVFGGLQIFPKNRAFFRGKPKTKKTSPKKIKIKNCFFVAILWFFFSHSRALTQFLFLFFLVFVVVFFFDFVLLLGFLHESMRKLVHFCFA